MYPNKFHLKKEANPPAETSLLELLHGGSSVEIKSYDKYLQLPVIDFRFCCFQTASVPTERRIILRCVLGQFLVIGGGRVNH